MNDFEPVAAPVADHEPPSRFAWLENFLTIFYDPTAVGQQPQYDPWKAVLFAVLLSIGSMAFYAFLLAQNDALRDQNFIMQRNDVEVSMKKYNVPREMVDKQLNEIRTRMESPMLSSVIAGLVVGVLGLFVVATIFWILQRLFNSEPPPFMAIASIAACGFAISTLGLVITVLMQFFTNSVMVQPSLAFLAGPVETARNANFSFLSKVNIFTFWDYLAVGMAVGAHVGFSRVRGIIIGLVALGIVFFFLGGMMLIYRLFVG